MKLSLRLLLLLPFILIMVGCPSDDATEEVIRPYGEVYNEDLYKIESFMDTHFMTVDADFNVTFTKITDATPGTPISEHPQLTSKVVSAGGVDHKLYYIKLREGSGGDNGDMQPSRLDSILPAYKGYKLDLTVFQAKNNPDTWFELTNVIPAWQNVFTEFKAGDDIVGENPDGTPNFTNFGAGVMFVPSGLAYFNTVPQNSGLSPYSTLIFTFKLMKVRFDDQDGDKILSKYEYGGPITGTAVDTDGDGYPDYGDSDDDGDGKKTKEEIRRTPGVSDWYPFNGTPLDDPSTPLIDERQGIPSCSNDYTTSNRLRRHLDPSCK